MANISFYDKLVYIQYHIVAIGLLFILHGYFDQIVTAWSPKRQLSRQRLSGVLFGGPAFYVSFCHRLTQT